MEKKLEGIRNSLDSSREMMDAIIENMNDYEGIPRDDMEKVIYCVLETKEAAVIAGLYSDLIFGNADPLNEIYSKFLDDQVSTLLDAVFRERF